MSENKTEVFVGGAVVALAIFLFYLFKTAGLSTGSGITRFTPPLGLQKAYGSVRMSLAGVKIGAVTQLELDGDTYEAKSILSSKKILKYLMIVL